MSPERPTARETALTATQARRRRSPLTAAVWAGALGGLLLGGCRSERVAPRLTTRATTSTAVQPPARPAHALAAPSHAGVVVDQRCVPLCVTEGAEANSDWGWERGRSCVASETLAAANQPCRLDAPLPPPERRPGVVVDRRCIPLCQMVAVPSDPASPDWAYENNTSCVLPETKTATAQTCLTGMPLPDPAEFEAEQAERPGVVVGEAGATYCAPLCTFNADPSSPRPDGSWDFEYGRSCVVPRSLVARTSLACTTSLDPPAPSPTPGVYINGDPTPDGCSVSRCVPLCTVASEPANPEEPAWAWEFGTPCLLAAALSRGGRDASSTHPVPAPPRRCTWGSAGDDFYSPPPLESRRLSSPTFYVEGKHLRDPYGEPFVIRAINNSHGWYDGCGAYSALQALDAIAQSGANAVRIGWVFESIDPGGPGEGASEQRAIGTHPDLLAEILHRTVQLGLIPILAFNDSTGQTETNWPLRMANFILQPSYARLFRAYEQYLLLGVANELNVGEESADAFVAAYTPAVRALRAAGLDMPLVITANHWGQGCATFVEGAPQMVDADPAHNLVFDLHLYTYVYYPLPNASNPTAGPEGERISACLDTLADLDVNVLVGEFGHFHGSGAERSEVAWRELVATCDANAQGYAPWLWYGDTEYPELNMAQSWSGPPTHWGRQVLATLKHAPRASLFAKTPHTGK